MERVRDLIQKLQQQAAQEEAPFALLQTVRLLAAELESLAPSSGITASGRVAVMLPSGFVPQPPAGPRPMPALEAVAPPPVSTPEPVVSSVPPAPELSEPQAPTPEKPLPAAPAAELPFNVIDDVPTLAQQTPPARELHQLHDPGASLNDRLRTATPELASRLTGAPIKDLRKGIGVNDRYLFLSELFRGDEAMYERSIKTINGFDILPEAEYWINRELKVKLGWDDSAPTVQQFYALVRRRFS